MKEKCCSKCTCNELCLSNKCQCQTDCCDDSCCMINDTSCC